MNWEDFAEIIESIAINTDGSDIDLDSIKSDIEDDPESYEIIDVIGHRIVTRHGDFIVAADCSDRMRALGLETISNPMVTAADAITLVSIVPIGYEAAESLKSLVPANKAKCEVSDIKSKDVAVVVYSYNDFIEGKVIGVWPARNWQKHVDDIIRNIKNDLMSVIGMASKHVIEDENNKDGADLI